MTQELAETLGDFSRTENSVTVYVDLGNNQILELDNVQQMALIYEDTDGEIISTIPKGAYASQMLLWKHLETVAHHYGIDIPDLLRHGLEYYED